jgi:ribosomal protein S18 acetylase RimI-like enzyme
MASKGRGFELETLNPWTSPRFRGFTAGAARALLDTAHRGGAVLAVGATVEGRPAGLALARHVRAGRFAVQALHVGREHRGCGIGSALLRRLEALLRQRKVPQLVWAFPVDHAAAPRLERWLRGRDWTLEQRLWVYECAGTVAREAWLARARIPAPFHVFSWGELERRKRSQLERPLRRATWISEALAPWKFQDLDPATSLGVERDGEIVGWILTQRESPSTLSYPSLCVRPDVRHRALGILLLAEAMRRHLDRDGDGASGLFTVGSDNAPMLGLVQRLFKGHLIGSTEMRVAARSLGGR